MALSRRAQQAAIAERLRTDGGGGEGLTIPAIAREMGISVSYAAELLSDPTGEAARARKRKYLKRCKVCGVLCHGERCQAHTVVKSNPKWTEDLIIEAIQEWEIEHGRPPVGTEWAGRKKNNLPEWVPTTRMVYKVFGEGGWNKAIEAAGFEPRPAHAPEYAQGMNRPVKPMGTEARERLSAERKELWENNPDHPMFEGLRKGHELVRGDSQDAAYRRGVAWRRQNLY